MVASVTCSGVSSDEPDFGEIGMTADFSLGVQSETLLVFTWFFVHRLTLMKFCPTTMQCLSMPFWYRQLT